MDRNFTIVVETQQTIDIQGRNYKLLFDCHNGKFSKIDVFNGLAWHKITADGALVGDNWDVPVVSCEVVKKESDYLKIATVRESKTWRIDAEYEVFSWGYIVCTFSTEALIDHAAVPCALNAGITLDEETVFSRPHRILNNTNNVQDMRASRALSIDFTTDDRPVTNSLNFLLESGTSSMNNRACEKTTEALQGSRFVGWRLSKGYNFTFPKGYRYQNRWALTLTGLDNSPNIVRGQRIYQYYGLWPRFPSNDMLEEMAEYGCSILALHNVSKYITGFEPDEKEMRRVVKRAHELGMKVIAYCQPYLISMNAPYHKEYTDSRTECLGIWQCLPETQICCYEPLTDWNCDELCLRSEKAYKLIHDGVINCYKKYGTDGIYIDFCWPTQGLCNDSRHGHQPGLFNFYDYLRLMRHWRKDIGNDIMIGHGGGALVSSDFVEGFDACLTGEAQKQLDPVTIGQQFGLAPTLWTMQRMKEDEFRSVFTVENIIREGVTPHVGVGVAGTAVVATCDPAHHIHLMALWQMWRAFPVEKATYYNYLTRNVITLDNKDVFYSLFLTSSKQVLLILVNSGKPSFEATPATRVSVKIDIGKLGLPSTMNCWRMKGATYETFRIAEVPPINDGVIEIPELGVHEYTGFVLSPGEPPAELTKLMKHLDGRPDRLPAILKAKQKRFEDFDKQIDYFATLPNARKEMDVALFRRNDRVAE
jgi:hypothetical protein